MSFKCYSNPCQMGSKCNWDSDETSETKSTTITAMRNQLIIGHHCPLTDITTHIASNWDEESLKVDFSTKGFFFGCFRSNKKFIQKQTCLPFSI